jgi:polysaccharide pyruvyl transferase WcaK-like protein
MLIVSGGGFLNQIWYTEHRKTRLFSIISVMLLAETAGKNCFFRNTIGPFGTSKDFYQIIFQD